MKGMKATAQGLVDCLEAEGVDVMFGIPGEETLDLIEQELREKGFLVEERRQVV